jgi:hypothetical protein
MSPISSGADDLIIPTITFRGPLAVIGDGNYVNVYGAPVDDHAAVIATSGGSKPFEDAYDYELTGLPSPSSARTIPRGSLDLALNDPFSTPDGTCRFRIRLKRPDIIEGIDLVDIIFKGQNATVAAGLLFVYTAIKRTQDIVLTSASKGNYTLDFTRDDDAHRPEHAAICRLVPPHVYDPCHDDAKAEFKDIASMVPKSIPDSDIDYPFLSGVNCAQARALVRETEPKRTPVLRGLKPAELRILGRILSGPGSDCQVIVPTLNF